MRWETLTASGIKDAIKKTGGLCILPLGVLEKHGNHLPVGTDMFIIHSVACRAAEKEPAVVFPPHIYTQIFEARHEPGAIAIGRTLMQDLLENICDEIARNGFKKIYLLNGHGGNVHFLSYFTECMLEKEKPYTIYFSGYGLDVLYEEIKKTMESELSYHAGEIETSIMMAIYPELVKSANIPSSPAYPLGRQHLHAGVSTPIGWYADFPDHYAGDARPSTAKKGEQILERCIDYVVSVIGAIKKDKTIPKLIKKYRSSISH
ncbi:MAG: creatininase family protein [Spirochaetales bacterium]|nr:creatininase family protein [Spirochaetales bacterium]